MAAAASGSKPISSFTQKTFAEVVCYPNPPKPVFNIIFVKSSGRPYFEKDTIEVAQTRAPQTPKKTVTVDSFEETLMRRINSQLHKFSTPYAEATSISHKEIAVNERSMVWIQITYKAKKVAGKMVSDLDAARALTYERSFSTAVRDILFELKNMPRFEKTTFTVQNIYNFFRGVPDSFLHSMNNFAYVTDKLPQIPEQCSRARFFDG